MCKVFISGSIRIKKLDKNVTERINNIINYQYDVIVGDANGVDTSIQSYLNENEVKSVEVYCTGNKPRNNLGQWSIKSVDTDAKPGTRAFFTAKDLAMAKDCDYGFLVWDTKSTGTLSNTIELLKRDKYSLVYINKIKKFTKIKKVEDLEELLLHMSESAYLQANKKLKLERNIEALKYNQGSLFQSKPNKNINEGLAYSADKL